MKGLLRDRFVFLGVLMVVGLVSCGRQSTKPGKPVCEVSPDTLDFGRVEVGNTAQRTFAVKNVGTGKLSVSIHADCNGFRILEGGGVPRLLRGRLAVRVAYGPEDRAPNRCSVDLGALACGAIELTGNGFRTWHIRPDGTGDSPTVQAGIDSSWDGDVVLVAPGTYYENINLRGKGIHLVSEAGPEATILDGSREDSTVVMCESGEDNATIIEGFTITGGSGWTPPWNPTSKGGGGIMCGIRGTGHSWQWIRDNRALNSPMGGNSRGGGSDSAHATRTPSRPDRR